MCVNLTPISMLLGHQILRLNWYCIETLLFKNLNSCNRNLSGQETRKIESCLQEKRGQLSLGDKCTR